MALLINTKLDLLLKVLNNKKVLILLTYIHMYQE